MVVFECVHWSGNRKYPYETVIDTLIITCLRRIWMFGKYIDTLIWFAFKKSPFFLLLFFKWLLEVDKAFLTTYAFAITLYEQFIAFIQLHSYPLRNILICILSSTLNLILIQIWPIKFLWKINYTFRDSVHEREMTESFEKQTIH